AATAPEVFQAQSAADLAGLYQRALVANAGATRLRIQHVKDQFDDHGAADTDYLIERFHEDPAAQLRTLKASPRGTEAVLEQWNRLDQELDHEGMLERSDVLLGIRLMGKRPNQVFTDTDVTCWFIAALPTSLTTSSDADAYAVAKRLLGQEWPATMDAREQEVRLRGLVAGRMGQDEAMAVYRSIIGEQVEGLTAHLEAITRKEKKARRDCLAAARSDATAEGGRRISQLLQLQRSVRQAQAEVRTLRAAREDQAAEAPEAAESAGEGAETATGGAVETAVPGAGTGAVEANLVVTVEADFETRVEASPAAVVESVLAADQEVTEEDTVKNGSPTTAKVEGKGTVEAISAVTVEPVLEAS